VDARHGQVRVDDGGAVAREVLGAGGDSGVLQPGDGGGGVPGDRVRVASERAGADHGVVVLDVDVHRGCEVDGDADLGEFGADGLVDRGGQLRVVDGAERGVAGVGAAGGAVQAGDVAAFLVDRDD